LEIMLLADPSRSGISFCICERMVQRLVIDQIACEC